MGDVEKDILARFTAVEMLVEFLLAQHCRRLSLSDSEGVKASFLGHQHHLGVGMMDAETLQDIGARIDASLARLVSCAGELEGQWRSEAGEL